MEEVATLHQKEIADKQPVGLELQLLRRITMKTDDDDDDDDDDEDLCFWPLMMVMVMIMMMMAMTIAKTFAGR